MSNSGNCTVFETPPSPPIQINFFSLYYLILTYFPKKYLFTLLHTIVLVLPTTHYTPHFFVHIFFVVVLLFSTATLLHFFVFVLHTFCIIFFLCLL